MALTMEDYPQYNVDMETIQITIDEPLLKRVDKQCTSRNRSAFFRKGAELLLNRLKMKQMEVAEIEAYKRKPVRVAEFGSWESEQVWLD
jgi:metal-responsive CopG/Arc/MetJ family transcriptional regulator